MVDNARLAAFIARMVAMHVLYRMRILYRTRMVAMYHTRIVFGTDA